MRRLLLSVVVAVSVAAVAVPVWSAARRSASSGNPLLRATQPNGEWGISCGQDTCTGAVVDPLHVATPVDGDPLDVVVTLSLDYRTSPKDVGMVRLRYRTKGGRSGFLQPGAYPLSADSRTSTTMTWSLRDLPGGGATYAFRPVFHVQNRGSTAYSFGGRHLLMVAELWE